MGREDLGDQAVDPVSGNDVGEEALHRDAASGCREWTGDRVTPSLGGLGTFWHSGPVVADVNKCH